jgi:hypothetical protein
LKVLVERLKIPFLLIHVDFNLSEGSLDTIEIRDSGRERRGRSMKGEDPGKESSHQANN